MHHIHRRCRTLTVLSLIPTAAPALANDYAWSNPAGGTYSTPANWAPASPAGGPGSTDVAHFAANTSPTVTYTSSPETLGLRQTAGNVTLNLSGETHSVTGANGFSIGALGGQTASLTFAGGTLHLAQSNTGATAGIGPAAGSSGILTLTGGSSFSSPNSFDVGFAGNGLLEINAGSTGAVSSLLFLGSEPTGNGTLNVLGSGTSFSGDFTLIGYRGAGLLTVSLGATASFSSALIFGQTPTAAGVAHIGAPFIPNATLNASGIALGVGGTASFNLFPGSTVNNTNYLSLSTAPGSTSTATLSAGSIFNQAYNVDVGGHAGAVGGAASLYVSGTLNLTSPGTRILLHGNGSSLNILPGADVTTPALITNLGSDFSFTGGTLTINGGALSINGDSPELAHHEILLGSPSDPHLVLTNGATLASAHTLTVGYAGTASLTVSAGATPAATFLIVGGHLGTGTGLLTGAGSSLTASSLFGVGATGKGTLTINAGAAAVALSPSTPMFVGANFGGVGTVIVNAGGSVSTHSTAIGSGSAAGLATVAGSWSAANRIEVGGNNFNGSTVSLGASGTLNVITGGSVSAGADLIVYSPGTVNLSAGGQISVPALKLLGGSFNLAGGSVTLSSLTTTAGSSFNFSSGTLSFTSNLTSSQLTTLLGLTRTLLPYQTLQVAGNTDLQSPLALSGGHLSTGTLSNPAFLTFNTGTLSLTSPAGLAVGPAGLLGPTLTARPGQTWTVTGPTTISPSSLLTLDDSTFNVAGGLTNHGEIRLTGPAPRLTGGQLTNNGLLRGDGRIDNSLDNSPTGEIRIAAADRLLFTGFSNLNLGRISLLGGTIEFTAGVSSLGSLVGRGTLIVPEFFNDNLIQLTSGFSDVFTYLINTRNSRFILTGNASATFHSEVRNSFGSEFHIAPGSTAVFLGPVTGAAAFTGHGAKFFQSGNSTPAAVATGAGSTVVSATASLTTSFLNESSLTSYGPVTLVPNSPQSTLATLDLSTTGTLDLSNNTLLLTSTPASLVRQYLFSNQLFSSTPDPADTRSIGYVTTPAGLLVKLTVTGDANLDGALNADDFALLDRGLLTSSSLWQQGDFNYDGTITPADYLLIDRTLALQQGGPLSPAFLSHRAAQFGPAYLTALTTSIPEPSVLLSSILYPLSSFFPRRRRQI